MADLPAQPPDDADGLQAWARSLADLPAGERAEALADLPGPGTSPWLDALARLFPEAAGRGPWDRPAEGLLASLEAAGLDPEAALDLAGALLSLAAVQEGWSDWEGVDDRGEVRQRARTLARTDELLPHQLDFLLFALRASDPGVYHPAALAVGRHAASSPDVRETVEGYARERGLGLLDPVHLGGNRSRRRLLLVQAGARAAGRGEAGPADPSKTAPPLPADLPGDPGDPLPSEAADVVALVRAVTALVEAGDPDPRVETGARALVAAVPGLAEGTLDRWVVEAWADLVAALPGPPAREPAADLLARLADVPDPPSGSVAGVLPALLRLDAGLELLPRLPADEAASLLAGVRDVDPDLRPLVLARAATWATRHPEPSPDWVDDALDRLAHGDGGVVEAAALAPLRGGASEGVRVLEALGEALREGPSWAGRSPRDRALLAFLALDAVRVGDPLPDRARALLDDLDLLPEGADPSDPLLGLLLEGLLAREPEGAEAFLDARLLHEAASPRLLLAVLDPEARAPPAGVADALEGVVRTRLRTDPSFDPMAFLARTAVRRPDPDVYRSLASVAAGRTYPRPGGDPFPLEAVAADLARDATEARSPPDHWAEDRSGGSSPLASTRNRLRTRLADLRDPGPPDEAAQTLVDVLGPGPPGVSPAPDTARGLLRAIHPRQGPVLAAGPEPWRPTTRARIEDALGDALRRIEDRIPDLQPRRLQALEDGADPAADVADALADVRTALVPHLPGPEADLLEAALGAVEDTLARWTRGVDALLDAWDPEAGVSAGDALLEALGATWSLPHRAQVLPTALRSIADPDEGDPGDAGAALEWALDRDPDPRWTEEERETWDRWRRDLWAAAAREAMAGGDPRDALPLLTADRYAPARAGPEAAAILDEGRSWCFDRYRLLPVARMGPPGEEPGVGRALAGFLAHFSSVWLALALGAILMLDFGDAWRQMAAAGDVDGVVVTALVGVAGAFAYTLSDLRRRDGPSSARPLAEVGRAGAFVAVCLAWALAVTSGMWWLLSDTGEVVRGAGAPLHVAVWAGFALFVGVFFGLVAKET